MTWLAKSLLLLSAALCVEAASADAVNTIDMQFNGSLSASYTQVSLGVGRPDKVFWISKDGIRLTSEDAYCFITGMNTGSAGGPSPTFILQTGGSARQWYSSISGGVRGSSVSFRCALF